MVVPCGARIMRLGHVAAVVDSPMRCSSSRAAVDLPAVIQRILLAAFALLALFFGGRGLVRFLASDETKIRRIVAEMEAAYNEGRPGACVSPLAKDWHHEGSEIDRELLLGALFETARDRDRETRQLRTHVDIDEDAARIQVDGEHATLALDATFSRLRAGQWEPTWRVAFEAELENGSDGWGIVKSRHEDRSGTLLGR